MEADDGEGMTSVEMEFPSGYTDPWPDEAFEVNTVIQLNYIHILNIINTPELPAVGLGAF